MPVSRGVSREMILSACREVAKGNEIVASALYGSRAAGYARKDSDYDILLVIRDYPEDVRYHYIATEGEQLAVLAVDRTP
jgi:predicted nucleotidyltransferase